MGSVDSVVELPGGDDMVLLKGKRSFLLAARAGARFPLCILTADEEYWQTLEEDDIIAVSAPEGGSLRAAAMLLELVRTHRLPLVVLPRTHPGSKRLKYVVSAGPGIFLDCTIKRGTHPEQHLLCSSEELGGISITGRPGSVEISNLGEDVAVERISSREILSFPK